MAANTDQSTNSAPADSSSGKPRRRSRRWLLIAGIAVLLLVLQVVLAPTLVSTGPGTSVALSIANRYVPGKIELADLSVGWLSGFKVDGLKITEPDGKAVLSADAAGPDFTLLQAARGGRDYGQVTVNNLQLRYEQYADGSTSLTRALQKAPPAEAPAKPAPKPAPGPAGSGGVQDTRVKLSLTNGKVEFIAPGQAPVVADQLTVNAEVATLSAITADLKTAVSQGASRGEIMLKKVIVRNLFSAAGQMQPALAQFEAEGRLTNLPIAMADILAKADGKLLALLGEQANADLTAAGTLANLSGALNATTPNLTSHLEFASAEKDLTVSAAVNLTIAPATWAKLTAVKSGPPLLPAVTKPVVVNLKLDPLKLPTENRRIDVAAILSKVTLQPVELAFATAAAAPVATGQPAATGQPSAAGVATPTVAAAGAGAATSPTAATLAKTGSRITITVPPALAAALVKQYAGQGGALGRVALAEPATLTAEVTELVVIPGRASAATRESAAGSSAAAGSASGREAAAAGAAGDGKLGLLFKGRLGMARLAATGLPQVEAVTIDAFSADVAYDTTAGPEARIVADVGLGQVAFPGDPRLADVKLANLKINVPSSSLTGPLHVTVKGEMFNGTERGTIDVKADLEPGPTPAYAVTAALTNLPLQLADVFANQRGRLVAIAGSRITRLVAVANSQAPGPGAAGGPKAPPVIKFTLEVDGDRLAVRLAGLYAAENHLEMHDSKVDFKLTPEAYNAIMAMARPTQPGQPAPPQAAFLQQDANLSFIIASLKLPLPRNSDAVKGAPPEPFKLTPDATSFEARFLMPTAAFKLAETGDVVTVKDLAVQAASANPATLVTITANGLFAVGAAQGSLNSTTTLKGLVDAAGLPQLAKATISTDTKLREVPLHLVDALAGLNGKLVRSLGPTMHEFDLTANSKGGGQPINFGVLAHSDQFDAELRGVADPGKSITITEKSMLALTVTSGLVDMIQDLQAAKATPAAGTAAAAGAPPAAAAPSSAASPRTVTLQKPARYRLNIARAEIGLPEPSPGAAAKPAAAAAPGSPGSAAAKPAPFRLDPQRTRLDAELTGDPTVLQINSSGEVVTLKNLKFVAVTANPAQDTVVTVSIDVEAAKPGQAAALGQVRSKTTLAGLVAADGLVQLAQAVIGTNTEIINVPTAPLDALAGLNGKLVELMGPVLKVVAAGNYRPGERSPFLITLSSDNARGEIPLAIDKDKILRLERDANLRATLTPGLSRNLGLANPMLFQAMQSEKPVELILKSDGFAVPLSPFDLSKIHVEGQLVMGTVVMQNGGLLNRVLAMLSEVGAGGQTGETIQAAFTPVTFRLDRGIATTSDLWISAPNLITMGTQAVAIDLTQGTQPGRPFDVNKVRGEVLLGVSGRDLQRISGLKDVFSPTYVYELRSSGPIKELKPDYKSFVSQLAGLRVKAEANKALARLNPKYAGIAGGLLDMVPMGRSQAEILTHWPNQPKPPEPTAPAAAPAGTAAGTASPPAGTATPPAGTAAAPAGTATAPTGTTATPATSAVPAPAGTATPAASSATPPPETKPLIPMPKLPKFLQ